MYSSLVHFGLHIGGGVFEEAGVGVSLEFICRLRAVDLFYLALFIDQVAHVLINGFPVAF